MRVRVVNDDGISRNTKILNAETGEEIDGVLAVTVDHLTVTNEPITMTLEVEPLALNIVGVASFVRVCPFCGETIQQEQQQAEREERVTHDTTTAATTAAIEDTDGPVDQVE